MGEDEVLVVIGDVLDTGAGGPAADVGVIAENFRGGRGGVDDDHVDEAEAEVDYGAICLGEVVESLVGFGAELEEVADDGGAFGAGG